MVKRHHQGSIFLPTFQPYIVYKDRTERAIGQRRLRDLYRQYRPRVRTFFPSWLNLENAWMVFPFYIIFITTILMSICLIYMIFEEPSEIVEEAINSIDETVKTEL